MLFDLFRLVEQYLCFDMIALCGIKLELGVRRFEVGSDFKISFAEVRWLIAADSVDVQLDCCAAI